MAGGAQFDVAVIGGGLVGGAIAFGLRELGSQARRVSTRATSRCARRAATSGSSGCRARARDCPRYGALDAALAREWPRFAAELVRRVRASTSRCRSAAAFTSASMRPNFAARVDALAALVAQPGFEALRLSRCSTAPRSRAHLPGLGPDVAGGTWCPLDGHCNPLALLYALHAALARAGCAFRPGAPVIRISARSDRLRPHDRGGIAVGRARRAGRRARQPEARADGRPDGAAAPAKRAGAGAGADAAVPAVAAVDAAADRRRHGADRRFAGGSAGSTRASARRCSRRWRRARSARFRRSVGVTSTAPGRRCG